MTPLKKAVQVVPAPTPVLQQALAHLSEAYNIALEVNYPPSEFACQIANLHEFGISDAILRWCVVQGLAEHLLEITRPDQRRRVFRPAPNLRCTATSCFVLSHRGLIVARQMSAGDNTSQATESHPPTDPPHFCIVPVWDSARRELRLNEVVIKRLRQPARNQESILAVFQEEGWPSRIDDPLSGADGDDAKDRLHNTVKRLNHQTHPFIKFLSDGTGEGVLWELAIEIVQGAP